MFRIPASTQSLTSPVLATEGVSSLCSPSGSSFGLQGVANRGALAADASSLHTPENMPAPDMDALINWVSNAVPENRRMAVALGIACDIYVNTDYAAEPSELLYADVNRVDESVGFPRSHPGHPDHPKHSRYADVFREIGYARLHLLLEETTKREKLAWLLTMRWADNELVCDRVGLLKDEVTVVAWDSAHEGDGVQASVTLCCKAPGAGCGHSIMFS